MNVNQRARELMAKYGGAANLADYGYDSDSEIYFEDSVLDMLIIAITPPDGFVLVPVVPTEDMLKAAAQARVEGGASYEVWLAMIENRPEAP